MFWWISMFIMLVSSHPSVFFYPMNENVSTPSDCEQIISPLSHKCNCSSDYCYFSYDAKDVFGYITFYQPQIMSPEISKFGYYINHGVTNFKFFRKNPPTVTYLLSDSLSYFVEIVHIK